MQVYDDDDLYGGQSSSEVKCDKLFYGYLTWSEESLMQVYDDGLHGGQRSSEVKCDKLCSMTAKLGSLMQVYDDDLHGGQRSSEVKGSKLCAMLTKLGQKNPSSGQRESLFSAGQSIKCADVINGLKKVARVLCIGRGYFCKSLYIFHVFEVKGSLHTSI